MDVEAAEPGRIEDRPTQQETVGGDDGDVRVEVGEGRLRRLVLEGRWRPHLEPEAFRCLVHCTPLLALSSACRARRLGVDGDEAVRQPGQRV